MIETIVQFWYRHERDCIVAIIVFLVSVMSFGLGHLLAKDTERTPIIIEKYSSE